MNAKSFFSIAALVICLLFLLISCDGNKENNADTKTSVKPTIVAKETKHIANKKQYLLKTTELTLDEYWVELEELKKDMLANEVPVGTQVRLVQYNNGRMKTLRYRQVIKSSALKFLVRDNIMGNKRVLFYDTKVFTKDELIGGFKGVMSALGAVLMRYDDIRNFKEILGKHKTLGKGISFITLNGIRRRVETYSARGLDFATYRLVEGENIKTLEFEYNGLRAMTKIVINLNAKTVLSMIQEYTTKQVNGLGETILDSGFSVKTSEL